MTMEKLIAENTTNASQRCSCDQCPSVVEVRSGFRYVVDLGKNSQPSKNLHEPRGCH